MEGSGLNLTESISELGLSVSPCEGSACSVAPVDTDGLQALVRVCRQSRDAIAIEVEGLSPVSLWPSMPLPKDEESEQATRLHVDLSGIGSIAIDPESHVVTAGAGVLVSSLEDELSRHGFTLGSQETPDTPLGSWLAQSEPGPGSARAFPGWSPVVSLEAVLLEGSIIRTCLSPRSATGPDLKSLLVGSQGRLGIITRATLRVHRAAPTRRLVMAFADVADALGAVVEALGRDLRPDALGLVDGGHSESILTWETTGNARLVERVLSVVDEVCGVNGGRRLACFERMPGDAGQMEAFDSMSLASGAAGPAEVRRAASTMLSEQAGPRVALGFGARWSRFLLVRRALINDLGGAVRIHIERALPEGGLGIACVAPRDIETARRLVRQTGGYPIGDEDGDSWIDGVACALLGGAQ